MKEYRVKYGKMRKNEKMIEKLKINEKRRKKKKEEWRDRKLGKQYGTKRMKLEINKRRKTNGVCRVGTKKEKWRKEGKIWKGGKK